MALAVHDGALYAGTYEGEARARPGTSIRLCRRHGMGRLRRARRLQRRERAGRIYSGDLYAAVSCYRAQGSSLAEFAKPSYRAAAVYRYAGGTEWVDCGQLGDAEDVFGLAVYNGELYGSAMYSAEGCSGTRAARPGCRAAIPARGLRCLGVFQGGLYATGYDVGGVFRYEGGQ